MTAARRKKTMHYAPMVLRPPFGHRVFTMHSTVLVDPRKTPPPNPNIHPWTVARGEIRTTGVKSYHRPPGSRFESFPLTVAKVSPSPLWNQTGRAEAKPKGGEESGL